MKFIYITFLFSIMSLSLAAKDFTLSEQEKAFTTIQAQVRTMQIEVQKFLDKIKTSVRNKKTSVTAKDATGILQLIEKTIGSVEDLSHKIQASSQKNTDVVNRLHQLVRNVFSLGEHNIMTELQESITILMGPLTDQHHEQSMATYLQRNFAGTGIDINKNIYTQVGLPASPSHDQIMNRYQQVIESNVDSQTKFIWRQIQYLMRQPIGMLMYDLWLNDKAVFNAVFAKLPKNELILLYQYLNVKYRQQIYEIAESRLS